MLKTRTTKTLAVALTATALIAGAAVAAANDGLTLKAGGVKMTLDLLSETGIKLTFGPSRSIPGLSDATSF